MQTVRVLLHATGHSVHVNVWASLQHLHPETKAHLGVECCEHCCFIAVIYQETHSWVLGCNSTAMSINAHSHSRVVAPLPVHLHSE
jgi:hypothetical protein